MRSNTSPTAEALERRALLSSDLATDFPLGIFNATANFAPRLSVTASAVQSDGKMLVAGAVQNDDQFGAAAQQLVVMRLKSNGQIDRNFGRRGVVTVGGGSGDFSDHITALALEPDGGILIAGSQPRLFINPTDTHTAILRLKGDGSADPSLALTSALSREAGINEMLVQPNGNIVIDDAFDDARIRRYKPDGTLDKTFNPLRSKLTPGYAVERHLTYINDQVYVLSAGSLTRLTSKGKIDRSFGVNGYIFRTSETAWHQLLLTPDNHLLIAGGGADQTIEQFNLDGSVDASFGNHGAVTLDYGTYDNLTGITFGAGGKLLAIGITSDADNHLQITVARLSSAGVLDKSFGNKGRQLLSAPPDSFNSTQFFSTTDGASTVIATDYQFGAEFMHFDNGGNRLSDFGGQPVGTLLQAGQTGQISALRRTGDDRVVAAGSTDSPLGGSDFYVARFLADGSLDPTFAGGAGWVAIDIDGGDDAITAMSLATDGKIILGGNTTGGSVLVRLNVDGTLDQSFGTHGHTTPVVTGATVRAIAIQSDGKIDFASDNSDRDNTFPLNFVLGQVNADGTTSTTFAKSGLYTASGSLFGAQINDMAIQPSGRIVLAGMSQTFAFFAAGFLPNGAVDSHFGFKGVFNYVRESSGSDIERIALLDNGSILAAGSSDGHGGLLELSRDGVLNTHLPGAVKNFVEPQAYFGSLDPLAYLTRDQRGRFIIANNDQVARLNPDFTLDTTFVSGGARRLRDTDFFVRGIADIAVLSNGRTVMATSFADGRGPLFSFRPDTTAAPGVIVNSQGTALINGSAGNDVVLITRSGGRVSISFNGSVRTYRSADLKRFSASLFAGNDRFEMTGDFGPATVFGDEGNDTLITSIGDDMVIAGKGNDFVNAGAGSDCISGGAGNDTLSYEGRFVDLTIDLSRDPYASYGFNASNGAAGEDDLIDRDFENVLSGSGDDTITGTDSAGIYRGGGGDDSIVARGSLYGDGGNDTLTSYFVDAHIEGSAGDDILNGAGTLDGGSGNDTIYVQPGTGSVSGQAGDDQIYLTQFSSGTENTYDVHGGSGIDLADFSGFADGVHVSLDDKLNDGNARASLNIHSDIENINGTFLADSIVGSAADNNIAGNEGPDTIYGGAGNDKLIAGGGSKLFGEEGDDNFDTDDGVRDSVDGGVGNDGADADHLDRVVNVETVFVGDEP